MIVKAMPCTGTSVSMQARKSVGSFFETEGESISTRMEESLQQSRLFQTSSVTLAGKHSGLCSVNSDCVLAGVRAMPWGSSISCCLQVLLPAVLSAHEGCSTSVASTVTAIAKNLCLTMYARAAEIFTRHAAPDISLLLWSLCNSCCWPVIKAQYARERREYSPPVLP
jgi:hypothetical protein